MKTVCLELKGGLELAYISTYKSCNFSNNKSFFLILGHTPIKPLLNERGHNDWSCKKNQNVLKKKQKFRQKHFRSKIFDFFRKKWESEILKIWKSRLFRLEKNMIFWVKIDFSIFDFHWFFDIFRTFFDFLKNFRTFLKNIFRVDDFK